jgi:hypothetical protein
MAKRSGIGDGDVCPLFPDHDQMVVLKGGMPPKQYCPHVAHDGLGGPNGRPQSRSIWPLYGFDETVVAYKARLDRAIRMASLPDLSDMEVL